MGEMEEKNRVVYWSDRELI